MTFQFPWTNLHELNLDWFLSKFKQFTNNYLETTATVELIPTTEQPEVTVTGGTLDDDTDIVDPFTFNFKLPINSSGGGAVNSVNGKVGDVVLNKTDIGLGNVANVAQYSASNPPPYPVTSVNGMTGDVIVQGGGGGGDVLSVNGKTGAVVLDKTDIGLGNVANVAQYSASNPPPYPVTSVNGQTGEVTISIPTEVSELTNDAGYITFDQVTPAPVSIQANTTLALTHAGKFLYVNSATAITITIPTNESVAFPVGTEIELCKWNTGNVTISPASGVYIASTKSARTISAMYGVVAMKNMAPNVWLITGDLG